MLRARLTCLAVGANRAGRAAAVTRRRLVDADAWSVAESRAVSTLLRVTEARYLVVDVTLAEITLAVPQERSS